MGMISMERYAKRALSPTLCCLLPQAGEGNARSRAARDAVIFLGALEWE
jgi:hypothetical protein